MAKQAKPQKVEKVEVEKIEQEMPLAAQVRGEIDMQVATARKYPRSIKKFKEEALALACLDDETAASCFYVLPRGGRSIEGPSARLAEIVANSWGNMRAESKVVDVGEKDVTARALAWDLEKNVAIAIETKRRIIDKNGKRYNEDMIVMTGNAACSIALRNAVFKVVPNALTKSILEEAKRVAVGDAETLGSKRAKALDILKKMGATEKQILETLGVKGPDDISLEHLATLRGLYTALKEGDTTVEEAFGVKAPERATVDMAKVKAGKQEDHTEPGEAQEAEEPEEEPEEEEEPEAEPEEEEAEEPEDEAPKPAKKPSGQEELAELKEIEKKIGAVKNRDIARQMAIHALDLARALTLEKDVLESSNFATAEDVGNATTLDCRKFVEHVRTVVEENV